MKIKEWLLGLMKKASFTLIISIILAVFIWFVVAVQFSPNIVKTIYDVPVSINLPATSTLELVGKEEITVDVKLSGKRSAIGNFTSEDIKVSAVLTGVSEPKYYSKIQLEVKSTSSNVQFTVESVTPETIGLQFDRQQSLEFDIDVDINDVSVPDGYILMADSIVSAPSTVSVQGPENVINRIKSAAVKVSSNATLTQSKSITSEIIFLDADGNAVEDDQISPSATSVNVVLPVKKIVSLPLKLGYVNVPPYFDTDWFEYQLTSDTVTVAAEENNIKNYYELTLGYINLKTFNVMETPAITFNLALPTDFISADNVKSVVATFDTEEFSTLKLNINDFTIVNLPPEYEAKIMTKAINDVTFVGKTKEIEALTPGDVIAQLDLSEREIHVGQYQMPISIYAPDAGMVWAVGNYTAIISISKKTV